MSFHLYFSCLVRSSGVLYYAKGMIAWTIFPLFSVDVLGTSGRRPPYDCKYPTYVQ